MCHRATLYAAQLLVLDLVSSARTGAPGAEGRRTSGRRVERPFLRALFATEPLAPRLGRTRGRVAPAPGSPCCGVNLWLQQDRISRPAARIVCERPATSRPCSNRPDRPPERIGTHAPNFTRIWMSRTLCRPQAAGVQFCSAFVRLPTDIERARFHVSACSRRQSGPVKASTAKFTAEELITKREMVRDEIKAQSWSCVLLKNGTELCRK